MLALVPQRKTTREFWVLGHPVSLVLRLELQALQLKPFSPRTSVPATTSAPACSVSASSSSSANTVAAFIKRYRTSVADGFLFPLDFVPATLEVFAEPVSGATTFHRDLRVATVFLFVRLTKGVDGVDIGKYGR